MVVLNNIFVDDISRMGKQRAKSSGAPIQIDLDINSRLDEFCGLDRIKRGTINKILRWFLDQPVTIKRVVLDETEDWELEFAEALEKWARDLHERASAEPPGVKHQTPTHKDMQDIIEAEKADAKPKPKEQSAKHKAH